MITLPLPMFAALILSYLTIQHLIRADRPALFIALLVLCAVQSVIVSSTQHYGVEMLRQLQPLTASVVPVLAWLSFQTADDGARGWPKVTPHLAGPCMMIAAVGAAPQMIDVVLPLLFAGYGLAILLRMKRQGALARTKLSSGPLPARIWAMIAGALLLSALSDVWISVALGMGHAEWPPIIVSIFTSLTLLGIGVLSMSPHLEVSVPVTPPRNDSRDSDAHIAEAELIHRLDAHMATAEPFLDPDLSLARLARQLHVPIKKLSAAINHHKGENVSRYVNRFRVELACVHLQSGANVTEAMLAGGFNTKSNFNREFLRVMQKTPSAFVASLQNEAV